MNRLYRITQSPVYPGNRLSSTRLSIKQAFFFKLIIAWYFSSVQCGSTSTNSNSKKIQLQNSKPEYHSPVESWMNLARVGCNARCIKALRSKCPFEYAAVHSSNGMDERMSWGAMKIHFELRNVFSNDFIPEQFTITGWKNSLAFLNWTN